MYRLTLVSVAAALSAGGTARADVIVNGGFETGTFAGWTAGSTQVSPFTAALNDGQNSQVVNSVSGSPAWFLRNKPANYFGTPATPITGYSAFNGFDGSPGYFFLRQGFTTPGLLASAVLEFDFAVQSGYGGLPRVFDVNVLNTSGAIQANVFTYSRPTGYLPEWTPTHVTKDIAGVLNGLGAGSYQLEFRTTIPQDYTGAAQSAIDNVSLELTKPVPAPPAVLLFAFGIFGLGFARRRATAG
jgi:hypothetical protein